MKTFKTKVFIDGEFLYELKFIEDSDIGMTGVDEEGDIKFCVSKNDFAYEQYKSFFGKGEVHISEKHLNQNSPSSLPITDCPFYQYEHNNEESEVNIENY